MSSFNKEKFLRDYNAIGNSNKQGQAQSASVTVNSTGSFDREKFLADYAKLGNENKTADYAKDSYKSTSVTADTNQSKTQLQQQNYARMQSLFAQNNAQEELNKVEKQIANLLAVQGRDNMQRQQLNELVARQKELNAQLGNPTRLERAKLSGEALVKNIVASPVAAADMLKQVATDPVEMEIQALERKADQGVLDAAGWQRLAELKPQQYAKALDTSGWSWQKLQEAQQAQEKASKGFDGAEQFLYDTGMSMATNLATLPANLVAPGASLALMGTQSMASKALDVAENGGSAGEAFGRGLASGGIEMLTEAASLDTLAKAFKGNVGKTLVGKAITKLVNDGKISPTLMAAIEQSFSEGGEELVSAIANYAADKAVGDPDATLTAEELILSFIGGAISGGLMGAGASVVGKNNVTDTNDGNIVAENVTENAQNVTENAVLQSTAKTAERTALENEVKRIVGIDTRSEVEKVTAKQQEYVDNVQKLVESGIAPAEHLEQAQRKAAEAITEATNKQANLDYQKLDADSGAVRQAAMDSGKGELVGNIEKFAAKRGFKVKYYSADADSVGNGFIDGDTIYINVQDSDVMAKTAIHETIHGLRGNNQEEYAKLYNSIMDYAEQYRALHDVADGVMAAYTNPDSVAYNSVLDDDGNVDADKLGEEVLCKLCEEVIKDPESFIRNIDGNRTVLDAVADLLRKIKNSLAITLTKSEKAKLDNAVMAIERYVRSEGKTAADKRFHISITASNEIDDALADKNYRQEIKLRDFTPTILVEHGAKDLPMLMKASHLRENILTEQEAAAKGLRVNAGINYHGLGKDLFMQVIDSLDNPQRVYRGTKNADNSSRGENYFLIISTVKDSDGNSINVPVYIEQQGRYNNVVVDANKIATVFGRTNINDYINREVKNGNLVKINKSSNKSNGLSPIESVKDNTASINNVSHFTENDNGNNLSDSSGNKLTAEQAEFFKNSAARDEQGRLLTVYHQTDADFTEFNTKSTGAGRYDDVMPDGIFVKPTDADIGLKGKKQMALYANITNPLQFRDRGEMVRYWNRNIPGYAEVQKQIAENDVLYQQKYDEADLLEDEHYKKIRKQLINKEITADEFRTMLEETETKKILAEWTSSSDSLRAQAKELINGYISDNDFDGIILENDAGSFGRQVKSYVVFDSNQLKNTDNVTPTKNPDIRYSSNTSADSGSVDAAEDLKGKTIRERIEARANSGVTAKSQNVQTKAENALIRTISNAFGVRYTDKQGIIKEMVKEISAQVKATGAVDVADIDRLVDTAFDKGVISSNEKAKMYPRLKSELRESRFKYQPSEVFQDMRNNYFGKLRFAKDGTDVDILYQQYSGKYPDLFPEDILNPEDQIVRIGQVYDSLAENEQSLADYYGDSSEEMKNLIKEDLQYAVGMYIQELQGVERFEADKRITAGEKAVAKDRKPPTMAEYKAAQDEAHRAQKFVDKLLRDILLTDKEMRLIDTLLKGGDPDTVTGPNRDKILAVYSAKKAVKDARAPIKAYQFDVLRKRNDVADDVLTTFRSWKDKKLGLGYSTETFERNILDIVPDKAEAKRIIDTYITPIHAAEAQSNRLKKAMRDRVRALNIDSKANNSKAKLYVVEVFDKSKPYTLQADESGLVQLYGEKKITKEQLEKVGADVAKIEKAVEEFRKIYEELYEMANNSLLRNGYAPLGKIKDYFPHFTEENDTVLSKLAAKAGFEVQTNRLPTSIAGLTETFKPGRNWWGNLQHRTGDTTLFDAVTGFDQYIEGVANIINQTDNIQNLRSLENRLRYLASDEGVRTEMDRIDTLDIRESEKYDLKQQLKDEVENSSLPNFVTYLRDYTNNLAGKKDFSDRQIEHDFGRGIYTVSKALEGRIASNMIGANIGSALTNFIPIAQAKAAIKTKYLVNAMNDTMRAFYGHDNGFENESDFLTNRFGSEKLVYTRAQRMSNIAGWLMNVCDRFTSNVVTRARYLQNIDGGMSSDEAMADANSFAAGLIADRSKGAVPLVFERQNPIVKAVTMFQVEQNNQLRYLVKDLPKDLEKKGITALVSAIVQYAVASWLYNELYKIFVGRRPAFDPIDIGFGLVKDAQAVAKGEMKTSAALTNAATTIAEELPFVSGLAGGGRVPISSALPDAAEVVKLLDSDVSADKKKSIAKKELTKPLWYLATPTAGGQIKKVAEAAELYGKNDGVQYSVQSDGSRKAQFAVDKTAGNVLQSALFGKWSSDEAQAYVNNNFKGLTKGQTENFEMFKAMGMSNSEAWEKAKGSKALTDNQNEIMHRMADAGMSDEESYTVATTYKKEADTDGNDKVKTEEAKAYLDSKSFTREQKAILFSCMCPNVKKNPYK